MRKSWQSYLTMNPCEAVTPLPQTHWKQDHEELLTPCSSSLRSCSGTFGELMASLRHWIFSSGMTYSSTSFSGRPRAVPCRAVDGMASSRIAPRSVVSLGRRQTSLSVWSRVDQIILNSDPQFTGFLLKISGMERHVGMLYDTWVSLILLKLLFSCWHSQ